MEDVDRNMSDKGSLAVYGDILNDFLEPNEVDCRAAFTTIVVIRTIKLHMCKIRSISKVKCYVCFDFLGFFYERCFVLG